MTILITLNTGDITYINFNYNDNTYRFNTGDITYNEITFDTNKCKIRYMFLTTVLSNVFYK
jgi:hypothetical protein